MTTFGIIINGIIIFMLLYYIVKIILNIIKLNKDIGKLENKLFLLTKPLRADYEIRLNKTEQVSK